MNAKTCRPEKRRAQQHPVTIIAAQVKRASYIHLLNFNKIGILKFACNAFFIKRPYAVKCLTRRMPGVAARRLASEFNDAKIREKLNADRAATKWIKVSGAEGRGGLYIVPNSCLYYYTDRPGRRRGVDIFSHGYLMILDVYIFYTF